MMNTYEREVNTALTAWQKKMLRRPSLFSKLSKKLQTKIKNWITEKENRAITSTFKQINREV